MPGLLNIPEEMVYHICSSHLDRVSLYRLSFALFFHLTKLKTIATSQLGTRFALQDEADNEACYVDGAFENTVLDPDLYISRFPVGTSPIETLIL
jgi:hypothetical protein